MCYLVQPRDRIFVKDYGYLSSAENMGKNIGENITQKLLDHAKLSGTEVLKTTQKREIQKTAEATVVLIGNKTADRITKVSTILPQNNSETITNEHD